MKLHVLAMIACLGVVLAVHLAMNGQVGARVGNAGVANAVFWSIGAVTALIVGLVGAEAGALSRVRDVHPLLLTAGAIGAVLVFAIAWLIPRAGAGPVFIILLAGQIIGGLMMSHFGWLGSPRDPLTFVKLGGAVLMLAGATMATMTRSSS